jgi:WD repeat-containing protein 26
MLKDRDSDDPNDRDARLVLRHTYMPKRSVDFAGPSYFGGKNDELVICAGKGMDGTLVSPQNAGLMISHSWRHTYMGSR